MSVSMKGWAHTKYLDGLPDGGRGGEKRAGYDDEQVDEEAKIRKGSFTVKRRDEFAPEVFPLTSGCIDDQLDKALEG